MSVRLLESFVFAQLNESFINNEARRATDLAITIVRSIIRRLTRDRNNYESEEFYQLAPDTFMKISISERPDNHRLTAVSFGGMFGIDSDIIMINVHIEPKLVSFHDMKNVVIKLRSVIQHELEHAAQHGVYGSHLQKDRVKPSGETPVQPDDSFFEYHCDPTEIEAYVVQFNRIAKLTKRKLIMIMFDEKEDIVDHNLMSRAEAEDLFDKWVAFAKKRFPKAIS